ncbi:MAG: hypothetical protein AABY09_00355, partial [Nanoarchaeota archaeon]
MPAYDIQTSNIGCAETEDNWCDAGRRTDEANWDDYKAAAVVASDGSPYDGSIQSIFCPNSYFAIMTGCAGNSWDGIAYEGITGSSGSYCSAGLDDADYPYFCVPKYSYKEETDSAGSEGDRCDTPDYIDGFGYEDSYNTNDYNHWNSDLNLRVYVLKPSDFITARSFYNDCRVKGALDITDFTDPYDTLLDVPQESSVYSCGTLAYCGSYYENFEVTGAQMRWFLNFQTYPVCSTLVQTSTTAAVEDEFGLETYNAAWTDRLWEESVSFPAINDPAEEDDYFGYSYTTSSTPFGAATDWETLEAEFDSSTANPDPYPHHVLSCGENSDIDATPNYADNYWDWESALLNGSSCDESGYDVSPSDLADLEAEARAYFHLSYGFDPHQGSFLDVGGYYDNDYDAVTAETSDSAIP